MVNKDTFPSSGGLLLSPKTQEMKGGQWFQIK